MLKSISIFVVLASISACISVSSQARSLSRSFVESHIDISESHKVYYKYKKAKKGKKTVVLLNGLIYAIENWSQYTHALAQKGYGVLQIAYSTQPESLQKLNGNAPYFEKTILTNQGPKQKGIETQTLINEVMTVVNHLKIKRFSLLSLSYGSIVASELALQQKSRIESVIFVAPAVRASHRYNLYGQSRHNFYKSQQVLKSSAYDPDYFYDAELYQTMSGLLLQQSSRFPEKGVRYSQFFHGVFQMARSSKWFDLKDYAKSNFPKVHLFIAGIEEPPLQKDQLLFWEKLAKSNKGSMTFFEGGAHALPGVAPLVSADITDKILRGKRKSGEHRVQVETDSGDTSRSKTSWN